MDIKFNLDNNYRQIPEEEDIYKDELDFYLDNIEKAIGCGLISKADAVVILKIVLRKHLKNDINSVAKTILGDRRKVKNTLFIETSSKIEQYV